MEDGGGTTVRLKLDSKLPMFVNLVSSTVSRSGNTSITEAESHSTFGNF